MGFRLPALFVALAYAPVGSFFLSPTCVPPAASSRRQPRHQVNFNRRAASSAPQPASWAGGAGRLGGSTELGCRPAVGRRGLLRPASTTTLGSHQEQASAEGTAVSEEGAAGEAEEETLPGFISHDAVSYWVHPAKGSNIWLVGTIHQTAPSVKLVEEVVSSIKPEVVMVELDSERISLLPPGEAMQTRNGLWWWRPVEYEEEYEADESEGDEEMEMEDDGDDGDEEDGHGEPAQELNEIHVAVREAEACGARVLLGDRDFQVTARMLEKAKRVDMATAKERESFDELTTSFDCEESTRAITRKECAQMKATAPKVFAVMCTQRDEAMAKHLMKLRGDQTTVAVFGMAHLDGVEKVLKGHGWKRQRAQ